MKTAIISGVTGQDGSYLAEYLLENGYFVVGLKRRTSIICTDRIDHLMDNSNFVLRYFNLSDPTVFYKIIKEYAPNEIYNLGAQTHVKVSFETPVETVESIVNGTLYWLEAIKTMKPDVRFYQASSSEMFGSNSETPQNEDTKFMPASPYACAKVCAHNLVGNYRDSYGLHVSSGILFNHESERRGETFVTRKVTLAASRIYYGIQDFLEIGNLDAKRDWGYAKDYVKMMHMMLQQEMPGDYVASTGETHTVREWIEEVFKNAGMPIRWEGEGIKEVGRTEKGNKVLVKVNPKYFRPSEVNVLLGDYSKAKDVLGWKPQVKFEELAGIMFKKDLEYVYKNEYNLIQEII